jgi:AraC-like DNA-binding protein
VDGGAQVRFLTPYATPRSTAGDAVVVLSRERNHSYSGTIKTLLDSLETRLVAGKPVGLILYADSTPASTAVDHLRVVVSALGGVPLAGCVSASLAPAAGGSGETIDEASAAAIKTMMDTLLSYPRHRTAGAEPKPPPAPRPPRAVEQAPRIGFEPAVPVDGKIYDGIEQAVLYIKENYRDQNLSLDMVANAVYMSRYHFSRKFRQVAGRRFIDYLIMLRMTEARKLLLQTNFTVTAIAAEVGYRDLSNFERSFKKLFGIQPSQYRQRYAGPAPGRGPAPAQLPRFETDADRRRPA